MATTNDTDDNMYIAVAVGSSMTRKFTEKNSKSQHEPSSMLTRVICVPGNIQSDHVASFSMTQSHATSKNERPLHDWFKRCIVVSVVSVNDCIKYTLAVEYSFNPAQ